MHTKLYDSVCTYRCTQNVFSVDMETKLYSHAQISVNILCTHTNV